jgi:hypothetical protein
MKMKEEEEMKIEEAFESTAQRSNIETFMVYASGEKAQFVALFLVIIIICPCEVISLKFMDDECNRNAVSYFDLVSPATVLLINATMMSIGWLLLPGMCHDAITLRHYHSYKNVNNNENEVRCRWYDCVFKELSPTQQLRCIRMGCSVVVVVSFLIVVVSVNALMRVMTCANTWCFFAYSLVVGGYVIIMVINVMMLRWCSKNTNNETERQQATSVTYVNTC